MIDLLKNCKQTYIMGVDEVGVGCLAGPTYICAFKARVDWDLAGVRDSKQLSDKQKVTFNRLLREDKSIYGFSIKSRSVDQIDTLGIKGAILDAYYEAIMELGTQDTLVIVDGNRFKETRYQYEAVIGGDDLVPHISAASILAKVARDDYMVQLAPQFPLYDWDNNKGYGSKKHLAAIATLGPTIHHRKSFNPVRTMLANLSLN